MAIGVVVCAALLAAPAAAQDDGPGTVTVAYFMDVEPGKILAFEEVYKTHVQWHAKQNDTSRWNTWERISGESLGFVVRSPGHHWKDFDATAEFDMADREHFLRTVGEHVVSIGASYTEALVHVSNLPEDNSPPPLVTVYEMRLKGGTEMAFIDGITKVHKALTDSDWPGHWVWLAETSGGSAPTFSLVLLHSSWADLAQPEKPFWVVMEEVYGRTGATQLKAMFDEAVAEQTSEMYAYREDLSYVPSN
jgi:hypothetical protein